MGPCRDNGPTNGAPVGDLEGFKCKMDFKRCDTGRSGEVERKYGNNAKAVVESCRAVVRLQLTSSLPNANKVRGGEPKGAWWVRLMKGRAAFDPRAASRT